MDALELIALASSVSLLAGWRLYLVTFATGVAMKFGWIDLPEQLAVLREQDLYPLTLLRLDEVINSPEALAGAVGQALGVTLPPPQPTPRRMPAGRWRAYAEALTGPFALLTPVAVRLGYAEA